MNWYLVHTKPRQEKVALLNLEQQGYDCYLPILQVERLCHGSLAVIDEPLFPRYLFIRLGKSETAKSWSPIRSTKGVSRLVVFGLEPARVEEDLIGALRAQEGIRREPQHFLAPGERVMLTDGPFAGIEAVYQMRNGENRVLILIELLSKTVRMSVVPSILHKVS